MTDAQIDDLWLAAVRASHEDGRVRQMFAMLVYQSGALAEREACAKFMEEEFDFCGDELIAAAAIRARGNNEPR